MRALRILYSYCTLLCIRVIRPKSQFCYIAQYSQDKYKRQNRHTYIETKISPWLLLINVCIIMECKAYILFAADSTGVSRNYVLLTVE